MILGKLLGEILTEMGFITRVQLEDALEEQKKILKEELFPEHLQRVNLITKIRLAAKAESKPFLGEIVVVLGFTSKEQVKQALEKQDEAKLIYRSLESEKLGTAIEMSSIVNSSLNLAEVLYRIMKHVNMVTRSEASTLMMLDSNTGELVFSVPTGPKEDELTDMRLPPGRGIAGWVAEHQESLLVPDVRKDSRFYEHIDKQSGFETKSILCVPLKTKGRIIGVLEVINKTDGTVFTEEDALLLNIFANQAALAVENARLYEELKSSFEELEDRVRERTSKLLVANRALEAEITNHEKTDEALMKSESRYRNLVEKLPDVISTIDREGIITFVNPAIESLLGYKPEEVVGRHFTKFTFPDDAGLAKKAVSKAISGQAVYSENRLLSKSGEIRWVYFSRFPLFSGDNIIGGQGVMTDITPTKLLQDQLIRSERLAVTGQLAAFVAHEINSPLQGITSLLNTIKKTHQADEGLIKNLDLLKNAFDHIRDTVKKLLDLNRPGKDQKQPVEINKIIEDTLSLMRSLLKRNKIKVLTDLSKEIPIFIASPQQMGQVFMNLINNAVEAIKDKKEWDEKGGEISISTHPENGKLIVRIRDTGPGIPHEDIEKIFDPFFTGKKKIGMGVGLSICYGIIQEHGGFITAENCKPRGALITLALPLKQETL